MFDVVPPSSGRQISRARRKKSRASSNAVVELDWRLPARLRRPVHEELQRQRRRRAAREAIVKFERRPLYPEGSSATLTGLPAASPLPNRGAEHHTGDVYQVGRPFLATAAPPYAGSFVRRKTVLTPPRKKSALRRQPASQKKIVSLPSSLTGERDVPYQWSASARGASKAPRPAATPVSSPAPRRRRFALPLHVSIWPFGNSTEAAASASKKKVQNTDSLMH